MAVVTGPPGSLTWFCRERTFSLSWNCGILPAACCVLRAACSRAICCLVPGAWCLLCLLCLICMLPAAWKRDDGSNLLTDLHNWGQRQIEPTNEQISQGAARINLTFTLTRICRERTFSLTRICGNRKQTDDPRRMILGIRRVTQY